MSANTEHRSSTPHPTAKLSKQAVDIGVVVGDSASALAFYCGVLGFEHIADTPMPIAGGGMMHRVRCGESVVKLVALHTVPKRASGGGIAASLGYRYLTIHVENLVEIVTHCEQNDVEIIIPITEVRPGVRIAMVHDPDENLVEFIEGASHETF